MSKRFAVYVASKFENVDEVRRAYAALTNRGFGITHDWTRETIDGRWGVALNHYLQKCAQDDVEGVRAANAVLLLERPEMKGAWVEVGIALALGIPVVVVQGAECPKTSGIGHSLPTIFCYLPNVRVVSSLAAAMAVLCDEREARVAKALGE